MTHDELYPYMLVVADVIQTMKEVPAPTLFLACAGFLLLPEYLLILSFLKHQKMVEETSEHMLRWIGTDQPILTKKEANPLSQAIIDKTAN